MKIKVKPGTKVYGEGPHRFTFLGMYRSRGAIIGVESLNGAALRVEKITGTQNSLRIIEINRVPSMN
ncbi:MAG TPA: hypothetical protein VFE46_07815 [Pirellulales bacterium]|nr:hypothetical protein [Pirellulales bacterium]